MLFLHAYPEMITQLRLIVVVLAVVTITITFINHPITTSRGSG